MSFGKFTYCSLDSAYSDNLLGNTQGMDNFYALQTPLIDSTLMTTSPMEDQQFQDSVVQEVESKEDYTEKTKRCSCHNKKENFLSEFLNLILILLLVYVIIYRPSL